MWKDELNMGRYTWSGCRSLYNSGGNSTNKEGLEDKKSEGRFSGDVHDTGNRSSTLGGIRDHKKGSSNYRHKRSFPWA